MKEPKKQLFEEKVDKKLCIVLVLQLLWQWLWMFSAAIYLVKEKIQQLKKLAESDETAHQVLSSGSLWCLILLSDFKALKEGSNLKNFVN